MSNEQPTFLVALRAEVGSIAIDLEKRLENRVAQVEQAFSSMGWELDTARDNLKTQDKRNDELFIRLQNAEAEVNRLSAALGSANEQLARSKETNSAWRARMDQAEIAYRELVNTDNEAIAKHTAKIAELQNALHTMFTPAQVCERVNAVHDELVAKLSAERKELETTQHLLTVARLERDEARLECQDKLRRIRGLQNLNRAQGGRLVAQGQITAALDALADMVKELQNKLDIEVARRHDVEDDYGKLVGEHEDHVKKHEVLRNLLMGNDPTPDCDRYTAFAIAMGTDRHTAKMAVHRFVHNHPVCVELKQALENREPGRVMAEELFVKFKPFVYDLLKSIYNMTSPAVSALQYGNHHGHQTLHKHIVKYRRFVDEMGRRNNTSYSNDVPDEVLRDNQG